VFTLERIEVIDTAEGANGGGLYYWYASGVEKIDDMTVEITFSDTFAFGPQLFTLNPWKILNPNLWSADTAETNNSACGIGPYVIESFTEGEELVFAANESYYGAAPKTSTIIIRYFADSSTMALALQNGEIDVAWNALSPSDTEAMRNTDGITVDTAPGTEIRYIVFDTNAAPFDNPDVRFGLAQLVNREEISDIAFEGTKVPLNSMVPVGMFGHKPSFEGTENMDEGIALLASAGFTADNPLVMDLWYSPTHYGDTEADVAAVLKSQLEASGVVEVNLQFLEWAAYRDASIAGDMPVSLYGWYPDYMDADTYITPFVPGSWAAGAPGYENEDLAALVASQAVELDLDARLLILADLQDLWVSGSHMVPLAQGALFAAYSDDVSGVVLDPLALFHFFLLEK
jgi:peptide/nickel transport system substrate-binding protein